MFYLFILESIGTSELMLIGLVALIIFGPRKLPELARMLGKAMNEFRRSTDEFKQTWEREVNFESESEKNIIGTETLVQRIAPPTQSEIIPPEIKEIKQANVQEMLPKKETATMNKPKIELTDKRDWL